MFIFKYCEAIKDLFFQRMCTSFHLIFFILKLWMLFHMSQRFLFDENVMHIPTIYVNSKITLLYLFIGFNLLNFGVFSNWCYFFSYLANRSIFPDCSRTSQTQATCSWVKPNDAIPVVGVELAEEVPINDDDSATLIGLFWDADAAAATAAAEYNPSAAALKLAGDTPTAEAAAALPYWPQTWAREEKFVIPESCISAAECNNEDAANAVFEATIAALLGELLLLLILLLLKIGFVFVVGIKTEFWISLFGGGVIQEVWIGDFCEVTALNVAIT